MQDDYHIYTHYVDEKAEPKTSVKHAPVQQRTSAKYVQQPLKDAPEKQTQIMSASKAMALTTAVAYKINSYVGELTENRVQQRGVNAGLTFAGLAFLTATNPLAGAIATASYLSNATINYGIKRYKENLSADYLRQLSGGTVKTGR